ncbi:hypothetical protein COCCADRAFT_2397 [Bipolaris zeicola 26-R-13]|uniref:Killer toxin Kp4 domain-containing protein n=1 Tax=Cochliobolus carbonum (strain 26-R-13) TaxID=930089 RepID=W6YYM7_COCC2|nr:uncharacterized protein COCCADRAFT_2397 [Bipolaris zeicola 26-R-13]EUC36566.1 hypothetical protein COCCADRAFT_2397 [Bipolaris zeicola 26-R-13]
MVAINTLITLALTQLAITVSAGDCKTHQLYCGSTLKWRGWTNSEIQGKVLQDMWNNGQYPAVDQIDKSLFKCAGQGKTLVWANGRTPCGNCVDGGAGKPDYCA